MKLTVKQEQILAAAATKKLGWFDPLVDPLDPDYTTLVSAGFLQSGNTVFNSHLVRITPDGLAKLKHE